MVKENYLAHGYFGKRIDLVNGQFNIERRERVAFSPTPDITDLTFSLDHLPQEYPSFGTSDFRTPAFEVTDSNGNSVSDMRYVEHNIYAGKNSLDGLPSCFDYENQTTTLDIILVDKYSGLKMILSYTVFNSLDVITRNVRFINEGDTDIYLNKVSSLSIDFPTNEYELIHLYGAWGKERHIERNKLLNGIQCFESKRGVSSHQHSPFLALVDTEATEDTGAVYGFNLVYSGNFQGLVEVDQFQTARLMLGINSFQFKWNLNVGESFQSPECVMVYSNNGLGQMSRTFHDLYRNNLVRSTFKDLPRPVVINNWEATYFDFHSEKLLEIAEKGKELGMEQFVLDDGWFGKRNDDTSSLGDWKVNTDKIPEGLKALSEKITNLGMGFGLWVEPEMISPKSKLYEAHPDWCIHVEDRPRTEARQQLVLDLSRKEVQDYIIQFMDELLTENKINYIKWDMNRPLTEIGSPSLNKNNKGELCHKYILGLYRVLEYITTKHSNVLFESCSGGGGRFDPGMFYYMPQAWTSDNSDAVERLKIQYGTSYMFPLIFMEAHISAVPNHQVFRSPKMKMRGDVAFFGNLGYEIDLTDLSKEDQLQIKEQTTNYKKIRSLMHFGDFYRLLNPFENISCAWSVVSKNKEEVIVGYYQTLVQPNDKIKYLKLKGLKKEAVYEVNELDISYTGSYLMEVGLVVPLIRGDYFSCLWTLSQQS
ncbi:MAG: alpha-galactosidase [Anaerocolumna sp.]